MDKRKYKKAFEEAIKDNFVNYKNVSDSNNLLVYFIKFKLGDSHFPDIEMGGAMFFDTDDKVFSFLVPDIIVISKKNPDTKNLYMKLNTVNQQLISGGFHILRATGKKAVCFRWSRIMEDQGVEDFFKKAIRDAIEGIKDALPLCAYELIGTNNEKE